MNSEFSSFIKEIKDNVNINIAIFKESGAFLSGDGSDEDRCTLDFEDIISCEQENATYFKVNYKNQTFILKIDGISEKERQTAYFIRALSAKIAPEKKSLDKEQFIKSIIIGNISYYQINRHLNKKIINDGDACLFLVTLENRKAQEVINVMNTYNEKSQDFGVKLADDRCVFIKYLDDTTDEYRSLTEYATFLARYILEETGLHINVFIGSAVKKISDIGLSYEQACISERLAKEFNVNSKVHSYKDYALIRMLEDLPKHKINEYLELLMDSNAKEIFDDKEMVQTAEKFLEFSLNISETSRELYLHRNTLTYRLDKIEKATGLDIRKFSDALTFRLITILSKLVG